MTTSRTPGRTRWLALIVLCLGSLMIVLDSTIVNVVLPSIRADLGFSPTSLAWVVNAYLLTFGGFLLLGGRLGDNADAVSRKVLEESIASIGAVICGRKTYDDSLPWWGADGATGPARRPLFVVTHQAPPKLPAERGRHNTTPARSGEAFSRFPYLPCRTIATIASGKRGHDNPDTRI